MKTLKETTLRMLQMHYEAGVGHIGGNLSCLPIIYTLFADVMQEGDLFILSKGHSAGALYAVLWAQGKITDDELKTFHQDGTRLAGHPIGGSFPDIRFSTGSLGHGLGLACGVAHARKLKGEPGRVYCLLSDGELQEGSTYEALSYSRRHELNIGILIDDNGLQGFDECINIATADTRQLLRSLDIPYDVVGKSWTHPYLWIAKFFKAQRMVCPAAMIVNLPKGRGVSFLENRIDSHYLPLTAEQYAQARQEIESA